MKTSEIKSFIDTNIKYKDWQFVVKEKNGVPYVQIQFVAPDNFSGKPETQHCRKWQLSEWMTPTEIVQTCWAAVIRAEMHEAAETFKYKGRDIYNTHLSVDALAGLCEANKYEHRGDMPTKEKFQGRRMFSVKNNPDPNRCPVCNNWLEHSAMGDYCSNCSYVDGYAHFTAAQAEKHKDIIIA